MHLVDACLPQGTFEARSGQCETTGPSSQCSEGGACAGRGRTRMSRTLEEHSLGTRQGRATRTSHTKTPTKSATK